MPPIFHQPSIPNTRKWTGCEVCTGISHQRTRLRSSVKYTTHTRHGCRCCPWHSRSVLIPVLRRYNPISAAQFNEHVFFQFYSPDAPPPTDDPLLSHQLALMFMVLAIGSLMDIKRPAYNIEAEKYHQLARAALFQSPIFEEPTLNAVQALVSVTRSVLLSTKVLIHAIL